MHLIDRLGEIRLQIRSLRKEAKEIVAKLDAGTITDTGQRYKSTTYQTTRTHPLPQPAPTGYGYQNPLSYSHPFQNMQNQFQGLGGSMPADSRAFGQSTYGVGEPALGFGKREG